MAGYFKVNRDGEILERSDKPLKFTEAEAKANSGRNPNAFIIVKVEDGDARPPRAGIRAALDKVE